MASNVEAYVDALGDFSPKDLKEKHKSDIKGTVLQEVEGHKEIIEGRKEDVSCFIIIRQINCFGWPTTVFSRFQGSKIELKDDIFDKKGRGLQNLEKEEKIELIKLCLSIAR